MLRFVQLTPRIGLALLFGVWVDRSRRRAVMLGASVARVVLIAAVPALAASSAFPDTGVDLHKQTLVGTAGCEPATPLSPSGRMAQRQRAERSAGQQQRPPEVGDPSTNGVNSWFSAGDCACARRSGIGVVTAVRWERSGKVAGCW